MALHIETHGTGPDLVLLHGWALQGGVFAPLVERLRDRYTLHVVDLPGHGASRDDTTPLTLDATLSAIVPRVPPAIWIGWSLGGLFAMQAAATRPGVRGLVALAATPRFVVGDDWPHAVAADVFVQFGDDLQADFAKTLDRFLALDTLGSEHAREELRVLRAALLARGAPTPRALHEGLALLQSADLRRAIAGLPVPSLWMGGHRDRLVPPAAMAEAARRSGGAAEDIAGGGHAPFLGHADRVAASIDAFASRLPVPAAPHP